jgi:hypothetical protein
VFLVSRRHLWTTGRKRILLGLNRMSTSSHDINRVQFANAALVTLNGILTCVKESQARNVSSSIVRKLLSRWTDISCPTARKR